MTDRVLMLENAWYSVISPEGAAAILWKNAAQRQAATGALKVGAKDLLAAGVIDAVIPEPVGGAQYDHALAASNLEKELLPHLREITGTPLKKLLPARYRKFRRFGVFSQPSASDPGETPPTPLT